ncbi:MobF family relaxase [Mycobacterium nebraskense]|uniref:MobF family relaxase n=1 Tax=Mycobacterium nebraskense TaxID=244292 RepID=UPI0021F32462|nr:MobF family relaxase [Mycobacterium nebraskense]
MMGIHKLTAGDGYLYLIRQTAAHDATERGRESLSDYYSEKGESAGRWVGRGLPGLADPPARTWATAVEDQMWRIEAGSVVNEDQMKALFGLGLHPNAGAIAEHLIKTMGAPKAAAKAAVSLGRPFVINDASTELQRRLAVAYRDHNLSNSLAWNAPIEENLRAQMRTAIARDLFAETYDRPPLDDRELTGFIATQSRDQTTSTAGYDFTFSPVKSFSVLWALAPRDLAKTLEDIHDQAVADTLDYIENNMAFTRMGAQGVAQVDVEGVIATAFTHRDSRAGDPDLHTHLAVSTKVRARGHDGIYRWLALDGRPLFKGTVSASEFYNSRIEALSIEQVGLHFAEQPPSERGKRPVREIVGVPTELNEAFSSRRVMIKARYTELAKKFQVDHGREPTTIEAIALHQRATLDTRTAKHEPRSLAEQRQQWRSQAIETLGSQQALSGMLAQVRMPRRRDVAEITDDWIAQQAAFVIETVSESRSSWQQNHVYAEALRVVRAAGWAGDHSLVEAVTAAALAEPNSVAHARISDSDLAEPNVLRRRDGASVYSTHGTALFTSQAILSAEKRVLAAAGRTDGRRVEHDVVEMALLAEKAERGRTLNAGQETMVREMATSGARVQLALAPAGTGKTTAMSVLSRAWEESGGTVLGLSPSANAAQVLRNDINTSTDTIDKFIWLLHRPDATDDPARKWFDAIDENTLIIVDEAGKAGTLQLDEVITTAEARGASVKMIADDRQLASISAGGILRDIEQTYGALNLTEVVRFKSRAEAQAGLALREGDPSGLAFYADAGRIHVGSGETIIDDAYTRWAADIAAGHDSTMLAPLNTIVTKLNERARLDRLEALAADPVNAARTATQLRETTLADGLQASAGDIVATRKNKRTLRLGRGGDYVRNGERWRIDAVKPNGALAVSRLDTGQKVTLPAWYVNAYTTLGYASTIDAAQGMTIGSRTRTGTCHVIGSEQLTRQQLYVAMSRATDENHIYIETAETDAHNILTPRATHPDTAIEVLTKVLAHDGAQVSATTAARVAADPFTRLGQAARMYTHSVGALAENTLGPAKMAAIDAAADQVYTGLTRMPAWPTLRMHLATIAVCGDDPIARLQDAVARRELDTAHDPAAVLDWRLDSSGAHSAGSGPLRWLPDLPTGLLDDPDQAAYLHARHNLVTELAASIRDTASDWDATTAPAWARPLLSANPKLRAEIAVFRAAHDVDDADTRLTGPDQYAVRDRRIQTVLHDAVTAAIGRTTPLTAQFDTLVDAIDPRVRRDPYWPQLATHLANVARTDIDLTQLLNDAADDGPLPDQMPGAALWWRLAGRLQPAVLEANTPYLRPAWLSDLATVFGTAMAETITADPAFARLVAAIDNADPTRWTPLDLLHVAYDHLRDVDHDNPVPIQPHEYAQLLTYSIDLFTGEHPYDHIDIPIPDEAPLSAEEHEELAHLDPQQAPLENDARPRTISDDALLEKLGLGYGGNLITPDLYDELPPDPLDHATYGDADEPLAFEDMLTARPLARPVADVVADVTALRGQYHAARRDLQRQQTLVIAGQGPAMRAADASLLELRARADRDRPYMLAVQDVMARWADAEQHYDAAEVYLQHERDRLAQLRADPAADEIDIDFARAAVKFALMQLPRRTPAEQFHAELTEAMRLRAEAAGGAEHIVTADDVEAARLRAEDADLAALKAARAECARLAAALECAETATAKAFAQAETRNAEHIHQHLDALRTEIDMLTACGDYRIERGFRIPAEAAATLSDHTAHRLDAVARSGFTVTAVHAAGDEALDALHVLHTAARIADRRILWCSPDPERAARIAGRDLADTVPSIDTLHRRIATQADELDNQTTIVVDRASHAEPEVLADLAEHAADSGARLILVDGDDHGWPPAPSAPMLKLLHHDLPWSLTLTTDSATPARRAAQPDRDAILDQAERCDPALRDTDIVAALQRRRQLRQQHTSAHRVHTQIWDRITDTGQDRENTAGQEL